MLKSSPPTGTLIRTKQLACASDIISDGSGLRLVVVNSSIAGIRASQLEAVKSVLGFEAAKDASYWTEGIYVVSDKAFKYVAAFLRTRPSLVVFEGCESLVVPNCPEIKADTVWMTTTDLAVHGHKGFVKNFIRTAYSKDLVLDLEGESLGVDYTRVLEYTYWDSNENSTNIIAKALDKGKTDLAIKAYPGVFCNAAHDSTGDCPICYEAPSTLVKTSCCNRDFCYGCFAKCITHSSNCPWCRQDACLSSTKMMTSYGRAPFKDVLLMNLILSELADDRESSFLVVTFDDLYTFRFYNNPLQTQAVWLTGGAGMVKDAVDRLRSRSRPVAVAKADSAVWAGLKLDVKHVVFTESESSSKTLMKRWMSCVPETAKYMLRMNDGRSFTDWRPHGSAPLFNSAEPISAQDAKQKVIESADSIIQRNRTAAANSVGMSGQSSVLPDLVPGFEVTQMCDDRSCSFLPMSPVPGDSSTGIGASVGAFPNK